MRNHSGVFQSLPFEIFSCHLTLNFLAAVQLLVLSTKGTGEKSLFVVLCPAFLDCYVPPTTQSSPAHTCTKTYSSL